MSTADTDILGADGTTVNTGHLNGSMRNMELRLGRPLQRAVCTLHQAELPLRKIFEHLDGPTNGPRSYSGPIGKLLKSDQLHLTPLNHHFTPLHLADIPQLSPEVKEKMSTDAVLLHDLSQYVNTGIPGSDNLAQRKIGPLNHSRGLTHATRIERLLLSTNPDEPFYSNLVLPATYITAIYFTGHMEVKYKPSITDSPAHFYNQIRRQAQYFSGDLLKVLQKNLQTNSSSAHPDNILVGMVACDDPVRREGAVMMILKIHDLPTIGGIREYILPKLFFKSSSFKSMIKFHNETGRRPTYTAWNGNKLPVTEPPLLMKKTRDELLSYVDTPFSSDYPSHTQRVETGVKLTTAGAARVVGQKRQLGECLINEASRKKSPGRVTRKRFNI